MQNMNHPLSEMLGDTMSKIREMIDVNTVVGAPITTPDGVTIIPVTKVSIGYGGGGSDFATKNYPAGRDNAFGGGAGAGVTITPVAFLVIRGENVRMLPIAEPASTSVDRLIELLPDLLDKADDFLASRKAAKQQEASAE
ncbi:MAG: GerW family sporulation protein [Clostridiales bacterium]|nr:GerW family sporulation protein [Clostridiales bacterium]